MATIADAKKRAEEKIVTPELPGLSIAAFDAAGSSLDQEYIVTEPSDHLKSLIAKNRQTQHLSARYVHGAPELPSRTRPE